MMASLNLRNSKNKLVLVVILLASLFLFTSNKEAEAKVINLGTTTDSIFLGGSLGIGTNNPGTKLEVFEDYLKLSGTTSYSHGILMDRGPAITTSALQSSLFTEWNGLANAESLTSRAWAYKWQKTDGTNWMVINNAGNVGIGTTTPAAKLDVLTGVNGSGEQILLSLKHGGQQANDNVALSFTPASSWAGMTLPSKIVAYAPGANNSGFQFITNNSGVANTALAIQPNGNVGIGTTTPAIKLTVSSGTGNALYMNGGQISGLNSTPVNTDQAVPLGYLQANYLSSAPSSSTGWLLSGNTLANDNSWLGSISNYDVSFRSNNTERMRILKGGNVGIGTTNPGAKLDISDNKTHVSGDLAGTDATLRLYNSNANDISEKGAVITFEDNYLGSNRTTRAAIKGGTATAGNTADGFLSFYTDSSGANSMQERMRINQAGNIGIGITNPTNKLDILGGATISENLVVSSISSLRNFFGPINATTWTSGTNTNNNALGPDLTNTAATFTFTAGNGVHFDSYKTFSGLTPGVQYTVKMYLKLGTASNFALVVNSTTSWNTIGGRVFNSTDGLSTSEWKQISYTFVQPIGKTSINLHLGANQETALLGSPQTAGTVFMWGLQILEPTSETSGSLGSLLLQPFAGNVGIGTTAPGELLTLNHATRNLLKWSIGDVAKGYMGTASSLFVGSSVDDIGVMAVNKLQLGSNNGILGMTILNGNVGIGTTTPTIKLVVNGGTGNSVNVAGGFVNGLNSTPVNTDQAVPLGYLQANYGANTSELWKGTKNGNIWNGDSGAGNVGVGTTNPGTYKLNVLGNSLIDGDFTVTGKITGVKNKINTVNSNLGSPTVEEMALIHGEFSNKFRFFSATLQEESSDGVNWIGSGRLSSNQLADLMLGEGQTTSVNVIPAPSIGGAGYYRLTWDAPSYMFLNALYIYNSTSGNIVNFKIEAYHNTNGWIEITNGNANTWPGHTYIPHSNIPFNPTNPSQNGKVRVTFSISSAAYANPLTLYAIEWLGAYPAGKRNVESYDRDKNVYFPGAIRTSGSFASYITGNLGIGTTTPLIKLSVNSGTGDVINVNGGQIAGLNSTPVNNDQAVPLIYLKNNYVPIGAGTGGIGSGIAGQTLRHNGTSWVANSTLYNNGTNIGIGTTNPEEKLHVFGAIALSRNIFNNYITGATIYDPRIYASGNGGSSYPFNLTGNLIMQPRVSSAGFDIDFVTNNGTNVDTRVVIKDSGNMGIGTTNPTQSLTISGGNVLVDNSKGYYTKNTGGSSLSLMLMDSSNNTMFGSVFAGGSNILYATTDHIFYNYPSGVVTETLRIKQNGNVGIGTTTPTIKLVVNGGTGDSLNVAGGFVNGLNSTPVNTDQAVPLGYLQANYSPTAATNLWAGTKNGNIWNGDSGVGNVGVGTTNPGTKLDIGGSVRTNNQFISTLAAGTAPLAVTSNTLNTNLNADLLDGYHASDFAGQYISTTATLTAGNWYRIAISGNPDAKTGGVRAHALFSIYERYNSTLFYAGYNFTYNPTLNLISQTDYPGKVITKIRVLSPTGADTYAGAIVEVYANTSGTVNFGMYQNTSYDAGWVPQVFTASSIPAGFRSTAINLNTQTIFATATDGTEDQIVFNRSGGASFAGNVGVGSTAPTIKLVVSNGTGDVMNVSGGQIAGLNSTPFNPDQAVPLGYLQANYLSSGAASSTGWLLSGNTVTTDNSWLGTISNYDVSFKTNNIERMRILKGGNVGIGTTSPSNTLSVVGGSSGGQPTGIQISNSSSVNVPNGWKMVEGYSGNYDGWLMFMKAGNSTPGNFAITDTGAVQMPTGAGIGDNYSIGSMSSGALAYYKPFDGSTQGQLSFRGGAAGTPGLFNIQGYYNTGSWNLTTLMNLTASSTGNTVYMNANVGIGTSNPGEKLTINAGNSNSYILAETTGATNVAGFQLKTPSSNWFLRNMGGYNAPNDRFSFYYGAELMTILTGGNVGVGTTTPSLKLVVNGGTGNSVNVAGGFVNGLNSTPVNIDQAVPLGYLQANYGSTASELWKGTKNGNIWNGDAGVGNVGIGTTNPGTINSVAFSGVGLHVNNGALGRTILEGSSQSELLLNDSGASANQHIKGITSDSGKLYLGAYDDNGTGRKHLTIDDSGNVGIGTTAPTVKLDIVGGLKVSGGVSGSPVVNTFVVGGDINTFYPIVWSAGNWDEGPVEVELVRSSTHIDSSWRGSLQSKFTVHPDNCGHGSKVMNLDYNYFSAQQFIAAYQIDPGCQSTWVVWLRGGGTTYNWRSGKGLATPTDITALASKDLGGGWIVTSRAIVDPSIVSHGNSFNGNFNVLGQSYFVGNVGIGTLTPSLKLVVNGGTGNSLNVAGGFVNGLNSTPVNTDQAVPLGYLQSNYVPLGAGSGGIGSGINGQTLRHNGTSWVANSTLYNNGTNVGIGTTNPGQKLDVAGNINTSNSYYISGSLFASAASSNISIGFGSMGANPVTSGYNTVSVGYNALNKNLDNSNTAVGSYSLANSTNAHLNTALGGYSLSNVITGRRNTGIGASAGQYIADGVTPNTTPNYSIYLGIETRALTDNGVNEIVIGSNSTGNGSNSVTLGGDTISKTILKGSVGIGTTTPGLRLTVNGGTGNSLNVAGGFVNGLNSTPVNSDQAVPLGYLQANYAPLGSGVGSAFVQGGNTFGALATLGTKDNNLLNFNTNNLTRMTIAASGNVGINNTNPQAALHLGGGMILNNTAVADTDYTLVGSDYIIAYTSISTTRTVNVPNSVCTPGRFFVIVDQSGSSSASKQIIIDPEGTTPIVGQNTFSLSSPYNSVYIFCGNSAWYVL